jgi:hypothetical protein
MNRPNQAPQEPTSSQHFEGFLHDAFDRELWQEYVVEVGGVRRIDFAEREPYVFPDTKPAEVDEQADEAAAAPTTPAPEPEILSRVFARIEESIEPGAHPSLQLVVLDNDGQATRSLFKPGPSGDYMSTAAALSREESDIITTSESFPQVVSADEFKYALQALFMTAPTTTLSEQDARYFVHLNTEIEPEAEATARAEAPTEADRSLLGWLSKQAFKR